MKCYSKVIVSPGVFDPCEKEVDCLLQLDKGEPKAFCSFHGVTVIHLLKYKLLKLL